MAFINATENMSKRSLISTITSPSNAMVKHLIKQRENLSYYVRHQQWSEVNILIHGQKIVSECVYQHKLLPNTLLVSREEFLHKYFPVLLVPPVETRLIVTSDSIIQKVCNVQSTDGVCAMFPYPPPNAPVLFYSDSIDSNLAFNKFKSCRRLIIINNIRDPGNLGTILRSAYSFAFDAAVIIDGSISPFNEKVIRATRTVLLQFPIIQCSKESFTNWLRQYSQMNCIVCTCATGELPGKRSIILNLHPQSNDMEKLHNIQKANQLCIVLSDEHVGDEGQFNSKDLDHVHFVHIPMARDYDSINVAQVGAITMHFFQ
jgi:tRNA G18 (ribose-2'-O)-methylase SpoU